MGTRPPQKLVTFAAPWFALSTPPVAQVVHDPAGLRVAVVLREDAPAGTLARIRAASAGELHDAGA
jgi:hypothetical protein